ncbi:MAG: class I SAM-dependent methyltransferase [Acidobacteriota bacterium]|nr:class I SAM-dependent methyltransferase [Acidobacteriota bacterium]
MANRDSEISHVSDTALMVAAARARETARSDGMVSDPYAARLAGERGEAILAASPRGEILTFGVGMRSRFLDDLLLELIAGERLDTVLLLGAGLDTRPWRLHLPADLRWIEADFADILEYKRAILSDEPRCRVERRTGDLNDAAVRAAIFAGTGERTLLITEGLLMYLPEETVEAIGKDAAAAGVGYWIMDLTSSALAARLAIGNDPGIGKVRAAGAIEGDAMWRAIERHGWRSVRMRGYVRDVMSIAGPRMLAMAQARAAAGLPAPEPAPADDPSGVHVFRRASAG